jgi:hypothetical protein
MSQPIARLFSAHPATVGETYFGHARFAFSFAGWLLIAGMAALVHAILPFLFETTASRIITKLHNRMHNRHGHSG